MPKRVTLADVAGLAGVHTATVSRALNVLTENQVNTETAKRVQKAAKQLGYIPNVMARGLRMSLSMTVGVIVPDLTNPIFPPMVRGIETVLSAQGYTALIANTDGSGATERSQFTSLLERRVDGFILATGQTDHPLLIEAYEREIKAVMINRGSTEVPYPLVAGDDAAGIRAAVRHLLDLGHSDILHIAGPMEFSTSRVRAESFAAALDAKHHVRSRSIQAAALTIEAGNESMLEVIAGPSPLPTAVVASNDLLALGAIRALRSSALNCPTDVSVVGFNDMPFAGDFSPPLTTVRVPLFDMGGEAARLLLEGISSGTQASITITLPVSFVERESTAAPRLSDT